MEEFEGDVRVDLQEEKDKRDAEEQFRVEAAKAKEEKAKEEAAMKEIASRINIYEVLYNTKF